MNNFLNDPNRLCCQSGCSNCPYDYQNQVDPSIPAELIQDESDDEALSGLEFSILIGE